MKANSGRIFSESVAELIGICNWNGANWIEQPKLTAGDGESNDSFGYSVSISGDYTDNSAVRRFHDKGAAFPISG
jgi:hypothetical protein